VKLKKRERANGTKIKKFAGLVTDWSQSAAVILTDYDRSVKKSDILFWTDFRSKKFIFGQNFSAFLNRFRPGQKFQKPVKISVKKTDRIFLGQNFRSKFKSYFVVN